MNYDTYLDKLYDMAVTIEDLRHQLKIEKESNKPVEDVTNWNFYQSILDITGENKIGSYESKDGKSELATMDDLVNIIEQLVCAYERLELTANNTGKDMDDYDEWLSHHEF